jgi:hypothetical protein
VPVMELFLLAGIMAVLGFAAHQYVDYRRAVHPAVKPIPHVGADVSPTPQLSPTKSWTAFSAQFGHYSLRYNPKWQVKYCGTDDTYDDLQLEVSADRLLPCNVEGYDLHIQMQVYTQLGDLLPSYDVAEAGYSGSVSDVTISGVAGHRYDGSNSEHTKYIKYVFVANGRTYEFLYHQQTGDSDLAADFERMVKTIKF